jgi:hypothetical protein
MIIIDLIILIIVLFVVYIIYTKLSPFYKVTHNNKNVNDDEFYDFDKIFSHSDDKIINNKKNKHFQKNNNHNSSSSDSFQFQEMQYHDDYRDVITSFGDLMPYQKQQFNLSDMPTVLTHPKANEVKSLVKNFISTLNNNIKNNVNDVINVNSGWDDVMPQKKKKSGWDKHQELLGLPSSVYSGPAKKSQVKLLSVDSIDKVSTNEQIQYTCTFVVQKLNVKDQMIIKVTFVVAKSDVNEDRNFFENKYPDRDVVIEDIFVVGYLIKTDNFANYDRLNAYEFNEIDNMGGDKIVDQQKVLNQLVEKYKANDDQMRVFPNSLLDQYSLHEKKSFKATRNVFDELTNKKIIYE